MSTGVLFPLRACKVFSKDSKDTYDYLDRIIKNSLLFFEEVRFEAGANDASYGETHSFSFKLPYDGIENYARRKTYYSTLGEAKRVSIVHVRPEEERDATWTPIAGSPARSYYVSFEGTLEEMLKNFSRKELDFIKFIYSSDISKTQAAVNNITDQITRGFSIIALHKSLQKTCKKWDIGTVSGDLILRETADAIFLSRACNSPPVLDELHKDVIELVDALRRETQEATCQIKTLSKVMELAISDYGAFNFEKILDLREEPSIKAFRKTISHISSELAGLSEEEINLRVAQEITKELVKDMQKIAPKSKRKVILSAAADCIFSTLVPPPYNVVLLLLEIGKTTSTAIRDINQIEKWNKSFGCFWMKLVK